MQAFQPMLDEDTGWCITYHSRPARWQHRQRHLLCLAREEALNILNVSLHSMPRRHAFRRCCVAELALAWELTSSPDAASSVLRSLRCLRPCRRGVWWPSLSDMWMLTRASCPMACPSRLAAFLFTCMAHSHQMASGCIAYTSMSLYPSLLSMLGTHASSSCLQACSGDVCLGADLMLCFRVAVQGGVPLAGGCRARGSPLWRRVRAAAL